ncbi:MAG: hypothetical protein KGD63_15515 [Candidatus Lokiarchaeota archaeon]|nr:hypothetical protein [Candidatus Lokiarchaeota archaeon]
MKDFSVISDTTPLLAFIKKNELGLLKTLFNQLIIPKAVYDEVLNTPKNLTNEGRIFEDELKKNWISVRELESPKYPDLGLGKGENEAINLCIENENPLLLIDEKKGRNIAKSLKIKILGTVGVLNLIKKKDLKNNNELIENINLIIKRGFYLSSEVILNFIDNLKK